jgi:hypothetical protein
MKFGGAQRRLPVALIRIAVQRVFESYRGRWSFNLTGENVAI